jgi:hypothetical protein
MDGNKFNTVICCFCGEPEVHQEAILLKVVLPRMEDETQTLFAHTKCFRESMHPFVPLNSVSEPDS